MADIEKVIKGLRCCTHAKAPILCDECPYFGNDDYNDAWSCRIAVMRDAFELLKEQEEKIEKARLWLKADGVDIDAMCDKSNYCPLKEEE